MKPRVPFRFFGYHSLRSTIMRCLSGILLLGVLVAGCIPDRAIRFESDTSPLQVSEDGRWFIHDNGSPFFYLGDTAWELFHRLDREEADLYLEDRASKGFTVIQAVVLAELDGLNVPNPYGHTPLIDLDPTQPNEAYFEHVDYIVNRAEELGMFIGMLPTWGDKFNRRWGTGPEIFTPENARIYGAFVGERYREKNIIWLLGGDRIPEEEEHFRIIRSMAEGIRSTAGTKQLMTYHPQGYSASYEWFHEDEWLDFHMFQSSHEYRDLPNYQFTEEGYQLVPVRPILDGEPRYEDHPVNWNPEEGWFSAFDVRQAAWWSMLSGAAGHTYGNHNIWQMWKPGRTPVSSARTPWQEALSHIGSTQVGYVRMLFESRPYQKLIPDQSVIIGDAGDGPNHIRAARASDGSFLFAYSPYGRSFTVDLTRLAGSNIEAAWFNPRTGETTQIGRLRESEQARFDPPGSENRGNDWVLVLDAE